ncbi:hypothetical protein DAPPUDRAFT_267839 [Daphnia pulex]|uniref:Uncharacterized protein n=1 Tax=Daphnia pulex TaxID=6669 RepID=E9HX06_DAPPU|nr:hypothetical protein DAPPUDRAFT_267839 [Daphnia pulex]|eukprot:EFX63727.1 hypothetical protein DAPPUDRAFT_267839 [Daphnia pulex]
MELSNQKPFLSHSFLKVLVRNAVSYNYFIALCTGVFDLNAPVYRCNKRNTCNYNRESAIINSSMFQSASKACAYVNHLIGKRVKKGKCWFEDNEMITSQAELQGVKEGVAKVRPQGKNTIGLKCGNSEFLAMKEVSSRFKNLDTAGIVMASCPHGSVLDAVDMYEGETFRHTLIPHLKLSKLNCKFLVNDVICKYWPFAQFLAKELKGGYTHLTTNMQGFFSRPHRQCHGWDCQVLYFGQWKEGAGAILGEEAEQI